MTEFVPVYIAAGLLRQQHFRHPYLDAGGYLPLASVGQVLTFASCDHH